MRLKHKENLSRASEPELERLADAVDALGDQVRVLAEDTADLQELSDVRGIDKAKAIGIVDYRSKNGPFQKVEELLQLIVLTKRADIGILTIGQHSEIASHEVERAADAVGRGRCRTNSVGKLSVSITTEMRALFVLPSIASPVVSARAAPRSVRGTDR